MNFTVMMLSISRNGSPGQEQASQQNRSAKFFDTLEAAKIWSEQVLASGKFSITKVLIFGEAKMWSVTGLDSDNHYVWTQIR